MSHVLYILLVSKFVKVGNKKTESIREYRIKRVVRFGILRKSALMRYILCANAPENFLERELGM